jgi:APA family basic amino acid/polyamine antiporter
MRRMSATLPQERPLLHVVHGPWNRKSISAVLSAQQHQHQHQQQQQQQQQHCYTDGGGTRQGGTDETMNGTSQQPHHYTNTATYTLWDLISVGVGGTVGSGIFVLTGYIANHYAGPATFISFIISGCAALFSGISFAEWSARLPRIEGSTYTYAYVSMGEYAAVLAASCLTLEYGVSGAAVARSWGDKVLEWSASWAWTSGGTADTVEEGSGATTTSSESFFNPLAGLISLCCVVVLACGVQESKRVTNFFTITKIILVAFMICGGFFLFEPSNMKPLIVPTLGATNGIMRGATSSFFGYLGFDEVCCLANEAKNPNDTPKAILYTLAIVTVVYILGSISLCGMLPYTEISDTSGFPMAFYSRDVLWASHITAFGEVFTLPVVVLISLLAQPRLCSAMSKDGLLPEIFSRQNPKDGNLFYSNILCGIPMTLLATFVPFSWMDDAISVGILFAFNMTNTALILMRCSCSSNNSNSGGGNYNKVGAGQEEGEEVIAVDEVNGIVSSSYPSQSLQQRGSSSLRSHLVCYHFVALMAGVTSHLDTTTNPTTSQSIQIGASLATLAYAVFLHRKFPSTGTFGDNSSSVKLSQRHDSSSVNWQDDDDNNKNDDNNDNDNDDDDESRKHRLRRHHNSSNDDDDVVFKVPLCPFLPLLGIYLNWYLISQLEWSGMILLLIFLIIVSGLYLFCVSGTPDNSPGQQQQQQYSDVQQAHQQTVVDIDGAILLREMSMPKR